MQALTLDQTGTGAKEKLTWKRIPTILRLYMGEIWTPPESSAALWRVWQSGYPKPKR